MIARGEFAVLRQLVRGRPPAADHAQSLEQFYAPQADHYDRFREKLLRGRDRMLRALDLRAGHNVVELGAGTGRNLEFLAPALRQALARVDLVDLCPSLLAVAGTRARRWHNVFVHEADAAVFSPQGPVDRIYLAYSLTMMPSWRAVLDNAVRMLEPGGMLGIVDFDGGDASVYGRVSRGEQLKRDLWRRWFAHDGVWLNSAHLPALRSRLQPMYEVHEHANLPYLPALRVPWYLFVGRKST